MHLNFPFSESDILRADTVPVNSHILADACFEGIRAINAFDKFSLRPLLQGLLNANPREQAVVGFYCRIAAYFSSLLKLDNPLHFQTLAASARSVFELGLDLALFNKDSSEESLSRLHAFTRVERYRVASKMVNFYAERPIPKNQSLTKQRALCADPNEKSKVEALIRQYWKGQWPKHWSRFQDARARAQHVGDIWEARYVQNYYVLSWHIHAGIAGVAGLPQDAFDCFAMEAFQLSTDVALDTYNIIGQELRLAKAMPKWDESVTFLRQVIGMALVDKRLQNLGEPRRFGYLEKHERGVS